MDNKVKVLLVEDDAGFVFLIKKLLEQDERLLFCGSCDNEQDALELSKTLQPHIVLMDLSLSSDAFEGIQLGREIRLATSAKILLLTSFENPKIIISASKKSFASGYIFKSAFQNLPDIIYQTATTKTPQDTLIEELILQDLSPSEKSILDITVNEIENPFHAKKKTIANQRIEIYKKLDLKGVHELLHLFKGRSNY